MGAKDRDFRVSSDKVINPYLYAEMGERLAKKTHKKGMRKYKRTKEKRDLREQINESY